MGGSVYLTAILVIKFFLFFHPISSHRLMKWYTREDTSLQPIRSLGSKGYDYQPDACNVASGLQASNTVATTGLSPICRRWLSGHAMRGLGGKSGEKRRLSLESWLQGAEFNRTALAIWTVWTFRWPGLIPSHTKVLTTTGSAPR
jgi:hypothetical protein